ncbi:hypothetical protein, unknown function [Leishmania tarentolae]|uniref:Nudix hydrolase domain-containing protein n=1 Tax=Leishmania tarentolae TaxID=5689 RepID=A0A640KP36_LEITA|nr:hypothetical protein, unknown function [Leishmania tarentolae]
MKAPSSYAPSEVPSTNGASPAVCQVEPSTAYGKISSHSQPNNGHQSRKWRTAKPVASTAHPTASANVDGVSQREERNGNSNVAAKNIEAAKGANEEAQLSERENKMVIVRGKDGYAYRRSVQVFFVNEWGQFLLCQPVGKSNANFRQTVQGGSEGDELPQETARREAWEEIGLDLEKDATFLCEVHPSAAGSGGHDQEEESVNEKNELVSERRKQFRYISKTWRKLGVRGQELYPLLYLLRSEKLRHADTRGWKRGVRAEFCSVEWGSLVNLVDRAPPSKKAVMASVCHAVVAAAKPFLESRGDPTTGRTNLSGDSQVAA